MRLPTYILRSLIHTFLSHPPSRAPLRTAVGTCHGAPRVVPWYALLVSLTLGRIDRGAPSTMAAIRATSGDGWSTFTVVESWNGSWCASHNLDPTATR